MNLEIIPLAQRDIAEAARYYRGKRTGLDDELLAEIDDSVAIIVNNPLQFAEIRRGIRCYLLDRFPYGIYYRVPDADTVRIIAVKHHKRRPGYGMRRK
jgi:toxin ParE1/3/4